MMPAALRFTVAVVSASAILVLSILWLHDESLARVQAPPSPLWGAVDRIPARQTNNVTLRLTWNRGVSIGAGTADGTVTALSTKVGARIDAGAAGPYSVDAVPIAWLPGPTPLFRDITVGLTGPDVDEVAAFFTARGMVAPGWPVNHPVDAAFLAAVRGYALSIGLHPAAAPAKVAFERAWVVWLSPKAHGRVTKVDVNVGDAAPALGTPIVEVGAGLGGASVRRSPQAAEQIGPRARQTLVIGTRRLQWDGAAFPRAALPVLERRIEPGTDSTAVVSEVRLPDNAFVVPAAALIAGASEGLVCVARFDATAARHARVSRVRVLTSNESGAVVEGDLGGVRILFNPGEMGTVRC